MENASTDVMNLLKVMVLLCILCVIISAVGEYNRMRKIDKVLELTRKNYSPGRRPSSSASAVSL